jgi:hypothetical protein
VNTIISLSNAKASRVREIIGFWPDEGDVHYIEDEKKEADIRGVILTL